MWRIVDHISCLTPSHLFSQRLMVFLLFLSLAENPSIGLTLLISLVPKTLVRFNRIVVVRMYDCAITSLLLALILFGRSQYNQNINADGDGKST